jgi:putative endonuclease
MAWFVYILECVDGTYYTGITNDVAARLQVHESGAGAKYTRGRSPLKLVYKEECVNRSTAAKREIEIKKMKRNRKMMLFMKGQ